VGGQEAICPVCQRPITLPGAEDAILPTPPPRPVSTSLEVVPAGQAPVGPLVGTSRLVEGNNDPPAVHGKRKRRIRLAIGGFAGAIVVIAALILVGHVKCPRASGTHYIG